ncbi:MAG: hypothetical protein JOZ96_11340 [Acidobacteria bacterium]|nr:hypothetical protein [Acidobacteriota bacterium]
MFERQTRESSESRLRAARIIWFAMMAAVGGYFLLGWMSLRDPHPTNVEATEVNVWLGPLLVTSLVCAFLSFAVRKSMLAKSDGRPGATQSANVVGFALAEAAALVGLGAALVTGNVFSFGIIAVGAVALLLHFPRA